MHLVYAFCFSHFSDRDRPVTRLSSGQALREVLVFRYSPTMTVQPRALAPRQVVRPCSVFNRTLSAATRISLVA